MSNLKSSECGIGSGIEQFFQFAKDNKKKRFTYLQIAINTKQLTSKYKNESNCCVSFVFYLHAT